MVEGERETESDGVAGSSPVTTFGLKGGRQMAPGRAGLGLTVSEYPSGLIRLANSRPQQTSSVSVGVVTAHPEIYGPII